MKRMAVISAGFVPVPAVDGGAGEVLTTYLIEGNEQFNNYFMDVYTIESLKLETIKYNNARIIQIHITKWNWFICKARNAFLKLFKKKYRFIPYNRALLKKFRDNYDVILIENNMQVYEDIYKHAKNGTDNMIYHMHNDIDGTTKPEYLCRFIAKTAKLILPVSKYINNSFNFVASNNKMKVLYNCIDLELFDRNLIKKTDNLKEKYSIKDCDYIFMYAGRVCKEKGIYELIMAFKNIVSEFPSAKLMIVGSTWYNQIAKDQYFDKLIQETKDIKESIIFTEYVYPNDMPEIYSLADVLVIPSLCEEAFGMVALEGMAMKLPIIATKSGGMVEILEDTNARLVDKDDNIVSNLYVEMKKQLYKKNSYVDYEIAEYDRNLYYPKFCDIIKSINT